MELPESEAPDLEDFDLGASWCSTNYRACLVRYFATAFGIKDKLKKTLNILNKQPKIVTGLIEGGEKIWTPSGQPPYLNYYTDVLLESVDLEFGFKDDTYLAVQSVSTFQGDDISGFQFNCSIVNYTDPHGFYVRMETRGHSDQQLLYK